MDGDYCNISSQINIPHVTTPELEVNCRNVWFREFWAQHNKCSWDPDDTNPCTGSESILDYEQEGLVPFVGKFWTHFTAKSTADPFSNPTIFVKYFNCLMR